MKIAIVGRGLIGSAAARHLAQAGHQVTLVGPPEPQSDWSQHNGVFSSHYDEGRITRTGDRNPFYARVARASIDRYRQIEQDSGISFYTPCGALIAGRADYMAQVAEARFAAASVYDRLGSDGLKSRFPFLSFATDIIGDHEPEDAGYISPRALLTAQLALAQKAGAILVPQEAIAVEPGLVRTDDQTLDCDEVIVAAGGWTDALLGRAPRHQVYARTVALHAIPPDEARRLATLPSIVLETPDIYVLPAIRYPDGQLWLKLGGDPVDRTVQGRDEINAWFRSGGDATVGDHLTQTLGQLIPGLAFTDRRIAPCVTTFTDTGLPEIERLSTGLTIAAAGNGAGAKCSDELGRLAGEIACGRKESIS